MGEQSEQISDQRRVWDAWGHADPLWAILSDPSQKGGRWSVDEFFASGRSDIAQLVEELRAHDLRFRPGRCLDFGCGVGRLTQALGTVFEYCDGVDISEAMVEQARRFNEHGARCEYHVNIAEDLGLFPDETFDFIYSTLVLQHNPPDLAQRYIEEFVRLLRPGGIAAFDMTAALLLRKLPVGGHRAQIELVAAPETLQGGCVGEVQVIVTNVSGHNWPVGGTVQVGNHWRSIDGALVSLDDGRTPMPGLQRGESVPVAIAVTAPSRAGDYLLDVDVVEEGVTWFADRGSAPASARVTVALPMRARWDAFRRRKVNSSATTPPEPEPFTMNALPRARVEGCVRAAGGRVAYVRPSGSAGADWETYRYFVVHDAPHL